jgi:hypothetical protein
MLKKTNDHKTRLSEELYVVELDERLEFGAAVVDSDLQADDNTGCHNTQGCHGTGNNQCTNDFNCT